MYHLVYSEFKKKPLVKEEKLKVTLSNKYKRYVL